MACAEPRLTALKIAHKGEIHRLRVDLSAFSYADLSALFAETYGLAPNAFVVQYTDPEGDVLNVTSEAEYLEACRVFLGCAEATTSLRFNAVSRTQVAFQENVTEPILKAIEKLVETLTAAMDKVKQEQWTQRAQSGMEHTGEVLNRAAKDTGEVLNRAAQDARESICAASRQIQDIPFDQMLRDTSDTLKSAADNLSHFAQEMVGDIREEIKKYQEATTESTPAESGTVEPAFPTPTPEPDWEEVEQQATPTVEIAIPVAEPAVVEAPVEVVAPPPPVVVAPVVSPQEQKWALQLSMIRDIFPSVDTDFVIEHLEHSNGNVDVTVNALMERM